MPDRPHRDAVARTGVVGDAGAWLLEWPEIVIAPSGTTTG
jgi:hypothetical protein